MLNKILLGFAFIFGLNLCYSQIDDISIIDKEKAQIDSLVSGNHIYIYTRPLQDKDDFFHEDNPTYLEELKNSGLKSVFNYFIPKSHICRIDVRTQIDSTFTLEKIYFNSKGQIIFSEKRSRLIYFGSKIKTNEKAENIDRIWIKEKKIIKHEREKLINGISNSIETIDLQPYKIELLFRDWTSQLFMSSGYDYGLPIKINDGYAVDVQIDDLKIQMNFRSNYDFMEKVGGDVSISITDNEQRTQTFFIKNSSFNFKKELFVNGKLLLSKEEFENFNKISNYPTRSPIEYLDFNFDGYKDIAIFTNSSLGFENYNLYIFNSKNSRYEYLPMELGGFASPRKFSDKVIPMPLKFDSINKNIQINYSWAYPWETNGYRNRVYLWDNGVLRLVFERTIYISDDDPSISIETFRNLKLNKWVITTKKYKKINGQWVEFEFNDQNKDNMNLEIEDY